MLINTGDIIAEIHRIPESLISKTQVFDAKTPITKIVPAVQEYDAIVVNKSNEYFGIIDFGIIYKYFKDLKLPKAEAASKFATRVPRITDSTSIDDVIDYFHKARTKALPYVKNNKISGILTRSTMIKILLSMNRISGLTVQSAMSTPLIAIDANATVSQTRNAMRNNKVNRLAVLDGNSFVGIVTNYDLVKGYLKMNERLPERKSYTSSPSNLRLSDIVQRNPRTIDQSRPLEDAVRNMVENNISSLIVTKGDKPVGIVTDLDIIISASAQGAGEGDNIFISGLDADTYQFEDELRDTLKVFIAKTEKFNRTDVNYISVVVKKFRTKSYEISARLSFGKESTLNIHTTGYIFERTMADLLDNLSKEIKKKKEKYITLRKVMHERADVNQGE